MLLYREAFEVWNALLRFKVQVSAQCLDLAVVQSGLIIQSETKILSL